MSIGFLTALQAVRKLIQQGLLWIGMPCSSWIWMSRGTTRRCGLRPRRSKKIRCVRSHNRLVRRVCYLFLAFMNLWSLTTYVCAVMKVGSYTQLFFSVNIYIVFGLYLCTTFPNCLRSKAGIRMEEENFLVYRAAFVQLAPILQTIGGTSYPNFLEIQCMMMQSLCVGPDSSPRCPYLLPTNGNVWCQHGAACMHCFKFKVDVQGLQLMEITWNMSLTIQFSIFTETARTAIQEENYVCHKCTVDVESALPWNDTSKKACVKLCCGDLGDQIGMRLMP